jgi:hypothetical protein
MHRQYALFICLETFWEARYFQTLLLSPNLGKTATRRSGGQALEDMSNQPCPRV